MVEVAVPEMPAEVYVWGDNSRGQLANGNTIGVFSAGGDLNAHLAKFYWGGQLQIVFGYDYNFGATKAGEVYAWGYNGEGQLSDGQTNHVSMAGGLRTPDLDKFLWNGKLNIITGAWSNFGAAANGEVYVWGDGFGGLLANGGSANALTAERNSALDKFFWGGKLNIVAGAYHFFGVSADGEVYVWGWNSMGELATGTTQSSLERNTALDKFFWGGELNIVAHYDHSYGITEIGEVWVWGRNAYGQLGNGDTNYLSTVGGEHNVDLDKFYWGGKLNIVGKLAYHNFGATENGEVYVWGYNVNGQLGNGNTNKISAPGRNAELDKFFWGGELHITTGEMHDFGATDGGEVYVWGYNSYGQLANDSNKHITTGPERNAALDKFFWGGKLNIVASYVHNFGVALAP
jgi:alpha-tubulin suppressor-like RCC1 family protein